MRKQRRGDPHVVVDHLALAKPRRVHDLVEVGESDGAAVDLYFLLAALARDLLLLLVELLLVVFDEPLLLLPDLVERLAPAPDRLRPSAFAAPSPSSSPRTAARLSSSAAIRSGALVGSGSSLGCTTTDSPFALRSISASSSSRYSSRYLSASKSDASESISFLAISTSRLSSSTSSSGTTPSSWSGDVTSSANRIVAIVSTSPIGRIAARCSLLRSTNRATATLRSSLIAWTSRAYAFSAPA